MSVDGLTEAVRIENSYVFVDGVGERTERKLWEAGLVDWDAFERGDPEPADAIVSERKRDAIERFIGRAREQLADGNVAFFADRLPTSDRWRLYENCSATTCFFDIETTGLDPGRNRVTTVSFHRDGETTTLVRDRDLTRGTVRREFEAADLLVSFNGSRFDVPFLEREFDLDVGTPHLDLMYPCRRLDRTGGLKRIEREVGIDRSADDVDGREAVRLWRRYERGDDAALERLVRYNREDARNLKPLLERTVADLDREVFAPFR